MNKNLIKQRGAVGLLLIACFLVISWAGSAYANTIDEANPNYDIQIDPHLLTEMNENGRAGYLIYFKEKADLSPAYEMDWEARGHFVVDTLRETAALSQRNVHAYLDHEGIAYRHFWIDNIVAVESSDINVLNGLLIFSEIDTIQAKVDMFLIEPEGRLNEAAPMDIATLLAPEPNLVQVNAPDVWALGIRGEGTIIANIDSGVRRSSLPRFSCSRTRGITAPKCRILHPTPASVSGSFINTFRTRKPCCSWPSSMFWIPTQPSCPWRSAG